MERNTANAAPQPLADGKEAVRQGVVYFALYVFIYGLLLFRFGMDQDEVLDFDGRALGTYVAGGRWMLGLWREVFYGGYLPYASGVIAGVLLSAALVVQTRMLDIRSAFSRMAYGCLYMGCIQFAWMLHYSHQVDGIAMGLLLSTAAAGFFHGPRPRYVAGVVCATLALAVYQTNILYMAVLYLACQLAATPKALPWKKMTAVAGCLIAALMLWKASVWLSWQFPWVTEGQIDYQTNYQKTLNQWVRLGELDLWGKTKYFGYFILMGMLNLVGLGHEGQWVYATALIPVAYLVRCYLREAPRREAWGKVLLLAVIWYLPFIFPIIMGTDQGPRTDLAEPLACAAIWALALRRFQPSIATVSGKILIGLLVLVVFKASVTVSVQARDEARDFRDGISDLRAMELCAVMVAQHEGMNLEHALLIGGTPNVEEADQALQAKARCLHSGTAAWYLEYLRSPFLKQATSEEAAWHQEALDTMPAWPAAGSVRVDKGEVIIRLEPSGTHPVPSRTLRERQSDMGRFRQ